MQLATSIGILQPAVLGFGVHGGPAAMQKIVNMTFERLRAEGKLRAFLDDLLLATGETGALEDPTDEQDELAERLFKEHLAELATFLGDCVEGGLKLKVDKSFFGQLIKVII